MFPDKSTSESSKILPQSGKDGGSQWVICDLIGFRLGSEAKTKFQPIKFLCDTQLNITAAQLSISSVKHLGLLDLTAVEIIILLKHAGRLVAQELTI